MRRANNRNVCYEFGDFRVDPVRRLVYKHGRRLALKPKVFDTLLYLVRNAGQLLEKAALIQSVWGTVLIDENGLNQHVSNLRRMLGERPGENRFIATIPGRGYCFVAEVKVLRTSTARGDSWRSVQSALQVLTPADCDVLLSRLIAVGRERAFETWTKPKLLRQWYPLPGWSMVVCELKLEKGGAMRFVTRHADGTEVTQRGIIREVVRPERLVHTEYWENPYMPEARVTTTFAAAGDETVLNVQVSYPTMETRDRFLESGLTRDIGVMYDRFAELAETGSLSEAP
jgi:DNA-binding winged helix-turn-helix (wHTH) protein/uncharacterized protein YndB with AHSA1/START domain